MEDSYNPSVDGPGSYDPTYDPFDPPKPPTPTPSPIPLSVLPSVLPHLPADRSYRAYVVSNDQIVNVIVRMIVERSGMKPSDIARRMDIQEQSLNQYRSGRRLRPTIQWLTRLAEVCGARIVVEWPDRKHRFGN